MKSFDLIELCKRFITPPHAYLLYINDLHRNKNIEPQSRLFLWCYRLGSNTNNKLIKIICRYLLRRIRLKYGIEIGLGTKIGKGFYLGHAFNITINPSAIIGNNVSIHKGVLIGGSNRGKKVGAPVIGNKVWIGCNAAIVGNVIIGDDVLIAPNTYINQDIPSHSVVLGNPCIVKSRQNATEKYINHIIE